ncbi:protein S100-Z-like [Pseudophryne corroboree]|uniref:protein S100-Z-like n=1 Tax=Pseudophryne corroboree TaxID=495146 RepID=UPI003081A41D
MPTQLETALEEMIAVFYEFSKQEGNQNLLTKGELQKLLQEELKLPEWTQKDPSYVDIILKTVDENKDGQVSFEEYAELVSRLIQSYHDFNQ